MKLWIALLIGYITFTGCASIPENGALLNAQVSAGIQRHQQAIEIFIKAIADIERNILDEKWEEIYLSSEDEYRSDHHIAQAAQLTLDQRIDIAAIAAAVREDILNTIITKEDYLIGETRHNALLLIDINDCVTEYLLSLQELDRVREDIANKFKSLTGIDMGSLIGTVTSIVDSQP